uniref:HTH CENPB-type domain-containing protein n=1 Tax=Petromyzon marinus TaxID=7757 RepID=S4RDI6_PETMA
ASGASGSEVKKRKAITLEQKLDVIKRYERNERTHDIIRTTGLTESTLRTSSRCRKKLRKANISASRSVRARPKIVEETERLLSLWIESQTKRRSGPSFLTIKQKALSIYEDLKKKCKPDNVQPFNASSEWLAGFKKRFDLHNAKLTVEAASADAAVAANFPDALNRVIDEGGYSPDRATAPGLRAAKDRLTVMLGANASGGYRLKPVVVHHSANPRTLKGFVRADLGVHFRSSKRGWMTDQMFTDYVLETLQDELRRYCKRKNQDFKILLVVDNAPSHPPYIVDLSEQIKVVFLPPHTTSLLQPMGQGVIAAFKAYYLRRTFAMLIEATDGENSQASVTWRSFNIKQAIDIIVEAWTDITQPCLNGVCRKLPHVVRDFRAFEAQQEQLKKIQIQCVALARRAGFEKVEGAEESHREELSTEELQKLTAEVVAAIEEDDDDGDPEEAPPRELTAAILSSALQDFERGMQKLEDNDCNAKRSAKILPAIKAQLAPYVELLEEKRKATKQRKIDQFLVPDGPKTPEDPAPSTSKGTSSAGSTFFRPRAPKETDHSPESPN